jgi:hypothetical protein
MAKSNPLKTFNDAYAKRAEKLMKAGGSVKTKEEPKAPKVVIKIKIKKK